MRAGLPKEVIDELQQGLTPHFIDLPEVSSKEQRAVYKFTQTYLATSRVDDEQYHQVLGILGSEKAMIQLVLVIGHYCNISAQLNILRIPAPGSEQPFPVK